MGTLGGVTNYRVKFGRSFTDEFGNGEWIWWNGWTRCPSWLVWWCLMFLFCICLFGDVSMEFGSFRWHWILCTFRTWRCAKKQDLNLSYLYTYVCKVLAGMVVPIHVHKKCMNIYIYIHITICLQKPIILCRYLLIVSEIFWDCARRWTKCRCWSWRLIASFDLRSAIRRGKNHLKAVFFLWFCGSLPLWHLWYPEELLYCCRGPKV